LRRKYKLVLITPAATASAATASTAAATSAIAVPASAITSAPSTAIAATTAATLARAGFVDNDIAAHKILAVETLYGTARFFIVVDFNEAEPARLSRKLIRH